MRGTSTASPASESLCKSPTQSVRSSSLSTALPVGVSVVSRWLTEWLLSLLLAALGADSLLAAPSRRSHRFTLNGWRIPSAKVA